MFLLQIMPNSLTELNDTDVLQLYFFPDSVFQSYFQLQQTEKARTLENGYVGTSLLAQ